jgi:glucokinase
LDILAFDFGGTQGRVCLATREAKMTRVTKLQRQPSDDGARWFQTLLAAGRGIATSQSKVVAVSFGGPVAADGRIMSVHVPGWEKIDLRAELANAFKLPVVIENDANCGAIGEHAYGAGRGKKTIAFFTVSTGIGGGVILDNKLFRGAHGMAAEFGHFVLHDGGPGAPQYAAGKPGALEALASGPAIARAAKAKRKSSENLTAKDVFKAAQDGQGWAEEVLDSAIGYLARGVAASICAYDPERVIIGGGVSLAGDQIFVPLRKKVAEYAPHYLEGLADIVPAALGDDAPILGAIALATESL